MGSFKREVIKPNRTNFKRLQPDIRVEMGSGEIKYLQPVAQDDTDGSFYAYVKDDPKKGVIAGLYTGEDATLEANDLGPVTTYVIVAKESIQGVDWDTDKALISKLKAAGIILTSELKATEEV